MPNNHYLKEAGNTESQFKSTDTGGVKTPHHAVAKADGTPLDTGSGNVSSATLRTVPATDSVQPVSASALPLPTGASTAGNQATANTSLSSIDTKTPALGQAVAANCTPVVLPTAQITTLTPPATSLPYLNSAVQAETALTTNASTTARSLGLSGYSKFSYQVDLTSVGTNVVIKVEGSNDGATWANLSGDQTLTANGTYLYSFDGIMCGYVRLTRASASGGTPSIVGQLLRGN